ncbi:MAG: hypothetical protein IJM81_08550 [Prevotella sp.]|nr:hypothetical protein [Prevotella sp.]
MKKIFTLLSAVLLTALGASAQDTYTVAGHAAILNGTASWAPANTDNDMTDNGDDTWTLVVTNCGLEAGTNYEYKVVVNHSWNESYPADNAVLTVPETAMYTVTFTLEDTGLGIDVSAEAVKTGSYTPGASVWTVAGSSVALLGKSWDPTYAANDMTLSGTDETGNKIYKLVLKNKTLPKGTILYKVAKDHDWGTAYPSSDKPFSIPEDGEYNVTFTFNEGTHALSEEVVKTSDAVIEHHWTVAGGPDGSNKDLDDALFGKTWDATITANDMTLTGGTKWILVKNNITLAAGDYDFKVCADHEWADSYGDKEQADGNATFTVEQAGVYNVTFTFDSESLELSATLTLISTGIRVQPVVAQPQSSAAIYDLQGRRLNGTPQRGLYIQNGKKIIVK